MALIGRTLSPASQMAGASPAGDAAVAAPATSASSVEQQLAVAERCLEAGEAREGLAYARQALALARGEDVPPGLFPRALLAMGSCERLGGEHGQSIAHLSEALRAFHELGDKPRQSEALVQLGQIQLEHGDYGHAVDLFLQALDAAEEAGDVDLEARINRCLGMAASRLRDHGQARHFYQRALELQRQLESPPALAASLNSLAVLELDVAVESPDATRPAAEQLKEAFALLEEALAVATQAGAARLQAQILGNIGGAYALLKEPERVIEYDERALALFRRFDAQREACVALANIGDARIALGEREKGLATLHESLDTAERHGFRAEQRRALLALSRARESAGEFGPALENFKRFHELDIQLRDAEAQQRVRQVALRHELDAAHQEAARLREISSELARKNRALEAQANQLDRLAREDPLTGLGNRRALEQWFIRWSLDPSHGVQPIALALLDIDHFKAINDRFSHSVGDAVLQAAADILRRHHRGSDVVVRYGGEEFVLVLPGTELESAHAMCERLRVAIETHDWPTLHPGLGVTASIGIAAGRTGEPLEALFKAADERLYQAKEAGRNQVRPRPDHVR